LRSKLCFASDANEAVRTRLNRDTRSHLCGSDSSARGEMSLDWRAGVDLAIERLGIVLQVLVALVGTGIFGLIAFVLGSVLVELVT
jgi:hypothetical protein